MPEHPPEFPEKTDRQLLTRIAWQFVLVFLLIVFFDTLLEWLMAGLHLVFELLHLVIEICEHLLEELLEHLLHTTHHQSETIIFNSAVLVAMVGLYRFFQRWQALSLRWRQRALTSWQHYKIQKLEAWQRLPGRQKLIVAGAYASGGALILFLLTL